MKCPVCKDVDLLMSERQGVEVDYCPTCRGMWLDRGELDKILARSQDSQRPLPATTGGDGQDDLEPPPERRNRRESWFSNLLDFGD